MKTSVLVTLIALIAFLGIVSLLLFTGKAPTHIRIQPVQVSGAAGSSAPDSAVHN
ncbi:hypothetical protein [Thauera butanivorans]|uniref:hypothetical protein n=1 Tax=Thauera butanivorans TaxID=86174 RepID=UPI0012FA8B9E|nr:hypothetical protein [Thauera butanivorans]